MVPRSDLLAVLAPEFMIMSDYDAAQNFFRENWIFNWEQNYQRFHEIDDFFELFWRKNFEYSKAACLSGRRDQSIQPNSEIVFSIKMELWAHTLWLARGIKMRKAALERATFFWKERSNLFLSNVEFWNSRYWCQHFFIISGSIFTALKL